MIFDSATDWFSEDKIQYRKTHISSMIEMPSKKLVFGTLGKRIKLLVEEEFPAEQSHSKEVPSNIDISAPMPNEDSSDDESNASEHKEEEKIALKETGGFSGGESEEEFDFSEIEKTKIERKSEEPQPAEESEIVKEEKKPEEKKSTSDVNI